MQTPREISLREWTVGPDVPRESLLLEGSRWPLAVGIHVAGGHVWAEVGRALALAFI